MSLRARLAMDQPSSSNSRKRRAHSVTTPANGNANDKPSKRQKVAPTAEEAHAAKMDVQSAFEDDLTCPICLELMVGSQLINPCGHMACGICSDQWITQKPNPTCHTCREPASPAKALIPCRSLDSIIEKHVAVLEASGCAEWGKEGQKRKDWDKRMGEWTVIKNRPPPDPAAVRANRWRDDEDVFDIEAINALLAQDGAPAIGGALLADVERLTRAENELRRMQAEMGPDSDSDLDSSAGSDTDIEYMGERHAAQRQAVRLARMLPPRQVTQPAVRRAPARPARLASPINDLDSDEEIQAVLRPIQGVPWLEGGEEWLSDGEDDVLPPDDAPDYEDAPDYQDAPYFIEGMYDRESVYDEDANEDEELHEDSDDVAPFIERYDEDGASEDMSWLGTDMSGSDSNDQIDSDMELEEGEGEEEEGEEDVLGRMLRRLNERLLRGNRPPTPPHAGEQPAQAPHHGTPRQRTRSAGSAPSLFPDRDATPPARPSAVISRRRAPSPEQNTPGDSDEEREQAIVRGSLQDQLRRLQQLGSSPQRAERRHPSQPRSQPSSPAIVRTHRRFSPPPTGSTHRRYVSPQLVLPPTPPVRRSIPLTPPSPSRSSPDRTRTPTPARPRSTSTTPTAGHRRSISHPVLLPAAQEIARSQRARRVPAPSGLGNRVRPSNANPAVGGNQPVPGRRVSNEGVVTVRSNPMRRSQRRPAVLPVTRR